MRTDGNASTYVGAQDPIPLPPRTAQATPTVGLVTCARCPLRIRPGAFHICLEPSDDAPALPPKPMVDKKPPPDERTRRHEVRAVLPKKRRCECGKPVTKAGVTQCRACYIDSHPKPECGTIAGYDWHRRQARKNPGPANPWPLPKADPCGCRAARAEYTRQHRGDA